MLTQPVQPKSKLLSLQLSDFFGKRKRNFSFRRKGQNSDSPLEMINMRGKILSICLGSEKGTKRGEVHSARLIADWGIEGDAHAGRWHRQLSLLSLEEIK